MYVLLRQKRLLLLSRLANGLLDRGYDVDRQRAAQVLQMGGHGDGHEGSADPHDRPLQVGEGLLGDGGGELQRSLEVLEISRLFSFAW